jgi:hypothetical protein
MITKRQWKVNNLLAHIKPDKHCDLCNTHANYTCFDCEEIQVREKYPTAFYNDDCEWELKTEVV